MPIRCFRELKESYLISWIEHIRSANSSDEEKRSSELLLFQSLEPIVSAIACNRENAFDYDAEQVINNAICILFLHYIRDPEFQFHSCGHIVSLLSQIAINERRIAFRLSGRAKRLPRDDDGNRLPVKSLQSLECDCESNLDDPACVCEINEQIENLLQWLSDPNHKIVFKLLLEEHTRDEISVKMEVDCRTVRLWVDQIRRILAPHTSHLTPHTSHLTPHTSHLKPQASSLKPIVVRGIHDQGYHSNSLFQRGEHVAFRAG
jgi:DNA-directed RNA polymerase specialized sigma24 family protein